MDTRGFVSHSGRQVSYPKHHVWIEIRKKGLGVGGLWLFSLEFFFFSSHLMFHLLCRFFAIASTFLRGQVRLQFYVLNQVLCIGKVSLLSLGVKRRHLHTWCHRNHVSCALYHVIQSRHDSDELSESWFCKYCACNKCFVGFFGLKFFIKV